MLSFLTHINNVPIDKKKLFTRRPRWRLSDVCIYLSDLLPLDAAQRLVLR